MTETSVRPRLAEELLETVGRLRRATRRLGGRPLADEDLSTAETELVRHVRRHPGTSVREAADHLGLAANTISTLVASLTARGILVRTRDPADRRVARLDLTPGARTAVTSWRDRRSTDVADALAGLTPQEQEAVAAALPALRHLIELISRQAGADDD